MGRHIKILISYDFSGVANRVLEYVKGFEKKIPAAGIIPWYGSEDKTRDTAISYYLEKFYSPHAFIEDGDLGKAIFEYTVAKVFDLLVILPGNHVHRIQRSEGRLPKHLCEHSKTPLLVLDL